MQSLNFFVNASLEQVDFYLSPPPAPPPIKGDGALKMHLFFITL